MKRMKLTALIAGALTVSMALAGCGSASSSSADKSDDGKMMTVDVYDDLANY